MAPYGACVIGYNEARSDEVTPIMISDVIAHVMRNVTCSANVTCNADVTCNANGTCSPNVTCDAIVKAMRM